MIGILYNAFYIEKYFPWAVQKYKDKNGEPAKALYGITVNEASKNFLWGYFHTIEGPFNVIIVFLVVLAMYITLA